jgi:hypothetical protein
VATDEYGRTPEYAGTTPGNPLVREKMLGRVLVVRPAPAPIPAFTNDQEVA